MSANRRGSSVGNRGQSIDGDSDAASDAPIGVFWDIENCHVPRGKSPLGLVQKIRDTFFHGHIEMEFLCVCDARKENVQVIQELSDAQVTIVHVAATSKNAADDKLRTCLRRFAHAYTAPASVILISGDINFASDLSDLRHRHKFHVILIHGNNTVSEALTSCAHQVVSIDSLVADVSPRTPQKARPEAPLLLVTGLPTDRPVGAVKSRLRRLSENCGGLVGSVVGPTATVRFRCKEEADRALKRLEGEDVFGRKIHVELKSELNNPSSKPTSRSNTPKENTTIKPGTKSELNNPSSKPNSRSNTPKENTTIKPGSVSDNSEEAKDANSIQNSPLPSKSPRQIRRGRSKTRKDRNRRLEAPNASFEEKVGTENQEAQEPISVTGSSRPSGHSKSSPVSIVRPKPVHGQPVIGRMHSGSSPRGFSHSPGRGYHSRSPGSYHGNHYNHNHGHHKNYYYNTQGETYMEPNGDHYGGRQKNVFFQQPYPESPQYYTGGGSYNSPVPPRRYGSSPRSYDHLSPKFRRTPGASRPNSCGPAFNFNFAGGMPVPGRFAGPAVAQGSMDAMPHHLAPGASPPGGTQPPPAGGQGGSIRGTPVFSSRSSSACSDPCATAPGGQFFQPIRSPSPMLCVADLRPQHGGAMETPDDDPEYHPGEDAIELMVSNLDYNISAREWKKILFTEFQQQVQVQGVYIQTQPDNTNLGYVRVGTIDEARYAISQFHRKKIGYKRIHVALVNNDSGSSLANMKSEVQVLLKEVTGNRLPLFKFIEIFEKRYHRNISVSELYRMKDTIEIQDDEGSGRMVVLHGSLCSPGASSQGSSGGTSGVGDSTHMDELLESPVCRQHCVEGSVNYLDALDLCCLPNVTILLKAFAPQVHTLLQAHDGSMPIMSFPACYAAEFAELRVSERGGVPLEHLVSCVPGVTVAVSPKSGIKKVQWAENKPPPQLTGTFAPIEFGRFCASPLMNQQLGQFSREVVDLLKTCGQCRMPFSKFIPSYHHHFGRQCRVADYGYTKLIELFDAIPHVVQILGGGSRRFVTLSHRAQVKRFTSDILRVLKSQASKQISVKDMPVVYNKVVGKPFDINDYGVCYIEDMLAEMPDTTVLVSGQGERMTIAIPRRGETESCNLESQVFSYLMFENAQNNLDAILEYMTSIKDDLASQDGNEEHFWGIEEEQTSEEVERTRQFSLEVIDLLKHSPQCRMPFNKFIPSYHHHFGKQCRVSDYGFTKLIELFESIPHIVQLLDEQDEKLLCLTEAELISVLEEQVCALLRTQRNQPSCGAGSGVLPVPEFLAAYMRQFGHSLRLQDYGVSSVTELIAKIPNTAKIEDDGCGKHLVTLVDHSYMEQLARRVLLILMDRPAGSMPLTELTQAHAAMFGFKLNTKELMDDLQGMVTVSPGSSEDDTDEAVVKLCPLQQFARDTRTLLRKHQGRINLNAFEQHYAQHFGVNLVPASYGYPSVAALLQAIPHVANLRGKGWRRMVLLCQDFQGKMNLSGGSSAVASPVSEASSASCGGEVRETKANTPSNDSGITNESPTSHADEESTEPDGDLLGSAPGSPVDLLGSVPSTVPSPDIQPATLDLMRFEATPSPATTDVLLSSLTAEEKRACAAPLCKTPVSDMLQFAATLLPSNPPMLPPNAVVAHADMLQQQHMVQHSPPGMGMSPPGGAPVSVCAAVYPPTCFTSGPEVSAPGMYQPGMDYEYAYAAPPQPAGGGGEMYSFEEYSPAAGGMPQAPPQEFAYAEYAPPGTNTEVYTPQYHTVQMEFQYPPAAVPTSQYLPDTSFPPPPSPCHVQYQYVPAEPPLTPFTPNSVNMSMLGKQMAEMVLKTPAAAAPTHSQVMQQQHPAGPTMSMGKMSAQARRDSLTGAQARRDSLTVVSKPSPTLQPPAAFEVHPATTMTTRLTLKPVPGKARSRPTTPTFSLNLGEDAESTSGVAEHHPLARGLSTASLPANLRKEWAEKSLSKWNSEGSKIKADGSEACGYEEVDVAGSMSAESLCNGSVSPTLGIEYSKKIGHTLDSSMVEIDKCDVDSADKEAILPSCQLPADETKKSNNQQLNSVKSVASPSRCNILPSLLPGSPASTGRRVEEILNESPPRCRGGDRSSSGGGTNSSSRSSSLGSYPGGSPGGAGARGVGLRGSPRRSRIAAKFMIPMDEVDPQVVEISREGEEDEGSIAG